MQWWDNFVYWFYSSAGSYVLSTVVVPAAAILVAGIIGALIGRGATKRIVTMHEREERAAATTASSTVRIRLRLFPIGKQWHL